MNKISESRNLMTEEEIVLEKILEKILDNSSSIETKKYKLISEEKDKKRIYRDVVFLALGGGNEIGASSYFIKINNKNFLIDSGYRVNKNFENEFLPKFNLLYENGLIESEKDLEMLLMTHGHLDHVGGLIAAVENFKNIPIYSSGATKDLTYFLLNEINFNNKSEFFDDNFTLKKYEQLVLDNFIGNVIIKNINEDINGEGYKIKFYEAGHILGARMILIDFEGYKVLITGDFSDFNQYSIPKYQLPENLEVDLLITEATNFNEKENFGREVEIEKLIKKINEALDNFEGGSVLIPAFSIGRSQEIALILKDAIKSKKINKEIPIYIDGTARIVSKIYEKHGVKIFDDIVKEAEPKLVHKIYEEQAIVISSSGMLLDGCKASKYIEKMLPNIKNSIIFPGYLAPNSKGAKLLKDYEKNLEYFIINGNKIEINAEVSRINLGAHTSKNGIQELIRQVKPKKVVLVHSDMACRENNLYDEIIEEFGKKIEILQSYNRLVTYL